MKITIEYNGLKFEMEINDVSRFYSSELINIITKAATEGLKLIETVNTNQNE